MVRPTSSRPNLPNTRKHRGFEILRTYLHLGRKTKIWLKVRNTKVVVTETGTRFKLYFRDRNIVKQKGIHLFLITLLLGTLRTWEQWDVTDRPSCPPFSLRNPRWVGSTTGFVRRSFVSAEMGRTMSASRRPGSNNWTRVSSLFRQVQVTYRPSPFGHNDRQPSVPPAVVWTSRGVFAARGWGWYRSKPSATVRTLASFKTQCHWRSTTTVYFIRDLQEVTVYHTPRSFPSQRERDCFT